MWERIFKLSALATIALVVPACSDEHGGGGSAAATSTGEGGGVGGGDAGPTGGGAEGGGGSGGAGPTGGGAEGGGGSGGAGGAGATGGGGHGVAFEAIWSRRFGDAEIQETHDIAVDASGSAVIVGTFNGTVDLGGGPLTPPRPMASKSALLAKYNAAGNHVWSKQFGVEGTTTGEAVALDASGAVIATGNCEGAVDLGGGLFTPTAWSDVWVAKYDAGGNHLWSKRFDAEWPMGSRSVAVDGDGNVILGGALSGTTDFGGGPVVSLGDFISSDAFIAKLDAAGNHLWSRSFGDVDRNDHVSEIVPDGAGDVFVIGDWAGSIDLGGGSLVSDDVAIFVAKLSATGAHLWSRRLSATGNIDPRRGAVDSAGNLFLTGGFSGTVDFGGRPLVSAGGEDVFLVELGPDGAHRFSARWGSAANENGMAVRVDGAGNLVMAGNHDGPLDFGGGPLVSAGEKDIFLARLSPRGAHIQSAGFGGPQHQVVFGAALDADGQPYLTGYFSGSVTFGASTLTSKGHDIFLAKFR